jgi:hypothetical protein
MNIEVLEETLVSVRSKRNWLLLDEETRELEDWEKRKLQGYTELRDLLESILYPLYDQRALEDTDTWEH